MAIAELDPKVPKGAVQSYESTDARRSNKKRSLRLSEWEIAELQNYWLGYAAEIGFRSVHGLVEAWGLKRPPSTWTKRRIVEYLEGQGGRCPEAKFISEYLEGVKNTLEIGIQRHEANEAIRELEADGRLERERVNKPNGDGSFMELRLVEQERGEVQIRTALRSVHSSLREVKLSAKERAWAAQDRELWLMWNEIPVSDDSGSNCLANAQQEQGLGGGHMGRSVAAALDAMSDEGAAVLQAAYGTPPSAFGGAYGDGLGHVATMTAAVRAERLAAAKRAAAGHPRETEPAAVELTVRREWAGAVVHHKVYSVLLGDRTPLVRTEAELVDGELRRIRPEDILRDRIADDVFRKRVAAEAEAMLVKASAEYRKVRIRG